MIEFIHQINGCYIKMEKSVKKCIEINLNENVIKELNLLLDRCLNKDFETRELYTQYYIKELSIQKKVLLYQINIVLIDYYTYYSPKLSEFILFLEKINTFHFISVKKLIEKLKEKI